MAVKNLFILLENIKGVGKKDEIINISLSYFYYG